jgi:hypothetical protein
MKEIELIKRRLPEIKQQGFIPSMRRGNTGVGYTLECLFGIEENNDSGADLNGKIEFKATRKNRSCRTSSFTQAPIWHFEIRDIIKKYGKQHPEIDDRINWYPSLNNDVNPAGLILEVDSGDLHIKDQNDDRIIGTVPIAVLEYRFRQKLDKLLLVYADAKKIDGIEHFHYNEAYICQRPHISKIASLIEEGKIVVEPRCHLFKSTGKIRDRGCAFRMKGEYLKQLYSSVERVV